MIGAELGEVTARDQELTDELDRRARSPYRRPDVTTIRCAGFRVPACEVPRAGADCGRVLYAAALPGRECRRRARRSIPPFCTAV